MPESKRMRHREPPKFPCETGVELDRLSSLPKRVLYQILSQLSIRDAVRTSALSRKWRYNWTKNPNLVFDNNCIASPSQDQAHIKNKLVNVVYHVLLHHTGAIDKFKLSHRELVGASDINRWILHLSSRPIKEFVLEIWKGTRYEIPCCLFSYQNLIHLELFNCLLRPPSSFKGFGNLKSLDLQHVTLAQDAFEDLITNCPLLERLALMNFDGFSQLKINAPNLQFFDIGGVFDDVSFEHTFHLTLVSIGLYKNLKNERNVALGGSSSKLLSFFANLPYIRRLEVQSYFLTYLAMGNVPTRLPKPCTDLNYLSIRVNFNDMDESAAALCLLKSSPNLQEVEMMARPEEQSGGGRTITSSWEDDHWTSLFLQLRSVKLVGISGVQPELDCIKFLLSNSPALERMSIKPILVDGGLDLLKDSLQFSRASVMAEIIYLDP